MKAIAQSWWRKPWGLGPVVFAGGAAVATLVLGVPDLWTATAAGWAAATGTVLAACVALYLGQVGIAANRRQQDGNTLALAAMLRPYVKNYQAEVRRIAEKFELNGQTEAQNFFAGTLQASVREREELSRIGQKFANPGLAPLLHQWSGAEPGFVCQVAKGAALINLVSDALRVPLREAPSGELNWVGSEAHVARIHDLLRSLKEALEALDRQCEALECRSS